MMLNSTDAQRRGAMLLHNPGAGILRRYNSEG